VPNFVPNMPKSAYLVLNIFHYFVFNLFLGPSNAFEVEETQKNYHGRHKIIAYEHKKDKKGAKISQKL